ncbi:MAG: cytochrome c [Candidatus Acidiferrum sp.]|jgi:mono/diheme cytochrome c family protein
MKVSILLLGGAVVVLGLGAAVTATFLHDGVSASATPTKFEAFLARNARHLATPSSARSMANPLQPTVGNLRDARLHFADHCAFCHANDGSGDTMMGRGMYPKPPDLRTAETQKLSDGELFWIVENGVRFTGMPAFGGHGSADDSWKLVLFLRHLPQLGAQERMEMGRYNPKGPDERKEEQDEDDFLNGAAPTPNSPAPSKH